MAGHHYIYIVCFFNGHVTLIKLDRLIDSILLVSVCFPSSYSQSSRGVGHDRDGRESARGAVDDSGRYGAQTALRAPEVGRGLVFRRARAQMNEICQ